METTETITLDSRAQHRLYVLSHVLAGELTPDAAGRVLRLSARQIRRLLIRYRADGAAAFIHGNRGRTPVNRTDPVVRTRLIELATTEFAGFNPVHLAETLAEEGHTDLAVSARTIRRIMAAAGQALPRTRRAARHRTRRERMPRAGMLLQVDGSSHDWLSRRRSVSGHHSGVRPDGHTQRSVGDARRTLDDEQQDDPVVVRVAEGAADARLEAVAAKTPMLGTMRPTRTSPMIPVAARSRHRRLSGVRRGAGFRVSSTHFDPSQDTRSILHSATWLAQ